MTNNNSISLKATGFIAISGLSAVAIMAAFDKAATFINTLPRATVERLADTIPVTIMGLCGLASMGGVLIAWAFSIARMRPMSASTSSASVGQQQLAPSPIRQLPPPIAQSEPRFAPYRGDIAAMVQREQQRAQHAEHVPQMAQDDEYTAFTTEYEPAPQHVDNMPQTPSYEPTAPINERITARLGDGQEVNISAAAWIAFASLDKPSRDAWRQHLTASGASAPNADYSKCKQIAESYRLLSGAGAWISPKMRDNVTQWLINP